MENGTRQNSRAWEKVYQTTDFGNTYPTDGLVSLYYHFIRQQLKPEGRPVKVLDFGCSHGANAKFFKALGFDVYGVDIAEEAIDYCIREQGFDRSRFAACDILQENNFICEKFGMFDLVIASECLYYFSKADCERILQEFYRCMNDQAVIYANMHTWNHHLYWEYQNTRIDKDGLVQIPASGLADLPLGVRIVADKQEMRKIFGVFEEIHNRPVCIGNGIRKRNAAFYWKKGDRPMI